MIAIILIPPIAGLLTATLLWCHGPLVALMAALT
ncbi:hypothetical protein CLBKND_01050 [Methylorubrum aminovorans]